MLTSDKISLLLDIHPELTEGLANHLLVQNSNAMAKKKAATKTAAKKKAPSLPVDVQSKVDQKNQ